MSSHPDRHSHQMFKLLNGTIVIASFAIIAGFILLLVANAFSLSLGLGLRSLCSGLLPPLAVVYLFRFANIFRGEHRSRIPRINLYVLSSLWMLVMLVIFSGVYDPENLLFVPVVELLFSFTLVALVLLYQGNTYPTALAASYGIVTGVLIFVIFVNDI